MQFDRKGALDSIIMMEPKHDYDYYFKQNRENPLTVTFEIKEALVGV